MDNVEIRTPRIAAALLLIVLACLLAPLGIVVSEVVAQGMGGSQPPRLVVSPDPISDAVAATPAEFRVDESGAATYSVPIFVVPGTAGVAPQLSLNYSSQGGYGPLGRGWSIGGLSAISRCRATREAGDFLSAATPDGDPRPVNFSASDRFCLDGQRLLPSAETCPVVGGMTVVALATEIESFQRVCAYTPAGGGNGPAFFTAERKDGSTSWYGDRDQHATSNRPDGYFESTAPGQTARALSWAQTRFQDSTGNYIDYLYLENPGGTVGEHLISEVRYTGKVALAGQSAPASSPYARVVFNYSARPTPQWSKAYASGGLLTQSRELDSITSCATIACETHYQVRHYLLGYQNSASGNGLRTLVSLKECRDNRVDAACATPTAFEWSTAPHDFSTSENPSSFTLTTDAYHDFKLGDINGDGRQDLALLYTAGSGCAGGTWVVSMLGTLNASAQPTFSGAIYNCVPANITGRGAGAWHLFDYDGDGRDDLFVSSATGTGWRVHPSNGAHFDMTTNLIAGLWPAIPSVDSENSQVQLADLNGDGLTDIVYPRVGGLKARVMERQAGGFAWGDERAVHVDATTLPPLPDGCDDPFNGNVRGCSQTISGMPTTKTGFMQMADFNGDAASDLLISVSTYYEYRVGGPGCDVVPMAQRPSGSEVGLIDQYRDFSSHEEQFPGVADPCWAAQYSNALYAFVVNEQNASVFVLVNHGGIAIGNPHALVVADLNGDGMSDVAVRNTASSDWFYAVNNGKHFVGAAALPLTHYRDQARFTDVNGDGRADLLYVVDHGSYKAYWTRMALSEGGFAAGVALPGGNARICQGSGCNEQQRAPIFADFDGDGNLDFLSLNASSSTLGLYFSRGSQRFVPRDTVVRITNGLGAKTELAYAPLTNTAVYRRANSSRNGLTWGRGAPVSDLLAPTYVVARASSSSPQAGNPDAMASVYYRYANGRVQAGGRGFLGFGAIETIDPNQSGGHVVTKTTYYQNFPFVGMPMQTVKKVVGGTYAVPACLTGPVNNTCFGAPGQVHPDLGGSWLSDNQQVWGVVPASLGSQAPLHVRTLGSDERLRDPFTGEQTSRVMTAFNYGSHGNVTQTAVDTYTRMETTPSSTVITVNDYADDVARWRLGRLTASTVTHRRPGQADVVRTAGFGYQMSGAATGLLTSEQVQPGGDVRLASTKVYQLDDYGNRLQTTTCAGPATPCSTSGFQFHPATATQVRRYARVTYDEQGRFATGIWEPFWTNAGSEERQTSRILDRSVFGDPMNVYDVNNVRTFNVQGLLGRPYYVWRQTTQFGGPGNSGIRSLTTYRKCDQVECPAGAAFRQQIETTAAPRQWTYFDVLGRPVMQAAETFNAGVADEDVAATCTDYTAAGQPRRVSNPFFLPGTVGLTGPTGITNACTVATRKWTTTTYDALGRPVNVLAPDGSQASVTYAGLLTTKTDPRGNPTAESRNGLGEVVSVIDAGGLGVIYNYFADGTVGSVMRDAGGGTIANYFGYDVLGRKTQQLDPDTGLTTFEYNALGELTAQVDSAGNRIEHAIDARGRVWRTVVKDSTGLTETESTFTYDSNSGADPTAPGQLVNEVITGTYAGWVGQSGTALDYRRDHYYDPMGRPLGSVVQVDGQVFGSGVAYDALGRPWQAMDVSGLGVKTEYGPRGHARALCSTPYFSEDPACAGADTFQRTLQVDAWGNVARERRGDSAALEVARTVWAETGRVASICAGNAACNLVNEQYGWDAAGNLSSHLKEARYLETFSYDAMNRLMTGTLLMRDGVTVNQGTLSMGYDALGNVCSRNGTGYGYVSAAGCAGVTGMAALPVTGMQAGAPRAPAIAAGQTASHPTVAPDVRTILPNVPAVIPNAVRDLRADPLEAPPTRRRTVPAAALAALGNLRAWETQVGWRHRYVQHASARSRSRDRDDDRASFMDDDGDWGLAHGVVADGPASFWTARPRRAASDVAPATATAARASMSAQPTAIALSTGPGGPHAVNQTVAGGNATTYAYDAKGNQVSRDAPGTASDRTIAYSLDDKAHEILMGSGQRVRFWYGPDGQRYKREEAGKVTYYFGGVEVIVQGGVTTMKRYVGGIALQTVVNGVVQGTKYLFHDHLGSLARIANADGTVAERLDYQAFGGRRSPSDPHAAGTASANTPRGYTGHEYVDGTAVAHMNGRIYDSELGRFLQADPVIQAPNNTQSWNAYTYVFNNPFAYTDPTGMFGLLVAHRLHKRVGRSVIRALGPEASGFIASIGCGFAGPYYALCYGAATYEIARAHGASGSDALRSGVIGAFTSYLGQAAAGITNPAGRVFAQAMVGGISAELQGGKFGHGFASAGLTAMIMPQIGATFDTRGGRIVAGAIVGGTISVMTGGKFANGAASGALQAAMMPLNEGRKGFGNKDNRGYGDFTRETPEYLAAIMERDPSLRLEQQSTWERSQGTGFFNPGEEHGFFGYESITDPSQPLVYRPMPRAQFRIFPSFARDYIPWNGVPTVPGYRLLLTYHTHPFPTYGFLRGSGIGPSAQDFRMAAMLPNVFHIVQGQQGIYYYGFRSVTRTRGLYDGDF